MVSEPRLTTDFWVGAWLRRLEMAAIAHYVTRRGDPTAGAVLAKVATLDGRAKVYERSYDIMADRRSWLVLDEGDERDVDQTIARQMARDPDLWVIEIEDREGRTLLNTDGLAD